MLARYLSSLREAPRNLRELIPPCLIAGIPFLLVLKQPDLGSAIVFVGILFLMLFWAGVKPSLLFMLASPGLSLLLAFNTWSWGIWMVVLAALLLAWRPYVAEGVILYVLNSIMGALAMPLWQRLAPYQQNRLLTFLNPEIDPRAAGYHAIQSRVAIGSGGWFGNGFTEGPQKRLAFLPAQHTDFIFSVVGEELGFVGVCVALALFLLLFLIMLRIASRATDPFASLVVFGVLALALHPRLRKCGDDGQPHADHRHSRCRSSPTAGRFSWRAASRSGWSCGPRGTLDCRAMPIHSNTLAGPVWRGAS